MPIKKKKKTKSDLYQKKNLVSRKFTCTCSNNKTAFIKYGKSIIKSISTVTARKRLFLFLVLQKKHFDIVIFWVGRKNSVVENRNCIVLPEARYVNSFPGNFECQLPESYPNRSFSVSFTYIRENKSCYTIQNL